MMGSGKSTIGRLLADRLNMSWIDMDEMIEAEGMKISKIFELHGEDHFRALEEKIAIRVSNMTDKVVSTGGGAVLRESNLKAMKASGKIVYLNGSYETLLRNLEAGRDHRPLLKEGSLEGKVKNLLSVRSDIYESCADISICTDRKRPYLIVDEVESELSKLLKL